MLRKIALPLLSLLTIIPVAHAAGFKQHVKVCLIINGNYQKIDFTTSFLSKDFFDGGVKSASIKNGETCIEKTYASGPKNIKLSVAVNSAYQDYVSISSNASCFYMGDDVIDGKLSSSYQRTGKANEYWEFTLTHGDEPTEFDLSCRHIGTA